MRVSGLEKAVEDYLVTIYKLVEACGKSRTTAIARELGVKPATVTKVLSRLAEQGLVKWTRYRGFELTERGRAVAERIVFKHRVAELWLHDFLGYDHLESHRLAHTMEHLPDDIVKRLYEKIGRPATCPHGNPIPGAQPAMYADSSEPLASFRAGTAVRLTRIAGEVLGVLEFAEKNKIVIGLEMCILRHEAQGVKAWIPSLNRVVEIPHPYTVMLRCVALGECGRNIK